MKTAMQKLIEIIEQHAENYIGRDDLRVKKAYRDIICAIDDFNLLETEKQHIIDAYKEGYVALFDASDPKKYYQEKFEK